MREESTHDAEVSGGESRLRLVEEFAAFGPAYMRWVKSCLGEGGTTYARMRLLGVLRCHGPQIMSGLSGELGVTPRNVTALVDALEEDGLVRRKPHPTDRRATVIEMTGRGESTCESTFVGHSEAVAELFDDLTEAERRELLGVLGKLRGAMRRRGISGS
ncbi:MarR family transcriptional regulator [Rubrobacter marinus]|uniref:MarR family transcriptional regulator n=1 Tax=Rubrobacter marinus TaxID=2653852 RepID=A0A6G8PZQ9_9ACTN|nr:MarR family transcriptional regulator [Rubrobacter marinus]QIN79713.1 MarR family transcriptional regulator [Rubrobacter marinus]